METVIKEKLEQIQSTRFDSSKVFGVDRIESRLYDSLSDSSGVIRDMCSHILHAGGKRIRPLLVLYSGLMFAEAEDELMNAAVAAELIHMASLVHDDIIDNSDLRRSRPSINKVWGTQFAVLCGDYLFAKAFGILSDKKLLRSMNFMVEAIQNMCHGEILQAGDLFKCNVSVDTYYERIAKKTAIFLECCCKSGAFIGGANDLQLQLMGEFGLNLGLAFQIIDDILDYCGDEVLMGKPQMEDLREGIITLPVIQLLKHETYGEWIKKIIEERDFTEANRLKVVAILRKTGIINYCFNIAKSYIEKAKQCLKVLPQSPYNSFLSGMADMLQARTN